MSKSVATYIADGAPAPIDSWGWKNKALPAIHMPRGVSRLSLLLEEVRIEQLQQITEADAIAEGIEDSIDGGYCWPAGPTFHHAKSAYLAGWNTINAKAPAASNPWVWVLSFRVLEAQRVGRPVIFSAPMIRALLAGRKTQTRRILKSTGTDAPVVEPWEFSDGNFFSCATDGTSAIVKCPYGVPGNQLWVREGVRRTP